jgi:hypothetical protein
MSQHPNLPMFARGRIMTQKIGLLGELLVELKLIDLGWHAVRLNARQLSVNTDLIGIKGDYRVSIQVKTTEGGKSHSHSNCLHLGNAGAYLRDGTPFFNSKIDPLTADIVVGVNYEPLGSRYFVLPVGLAEAMCVEHSRFWTSVPKRNNEKRSNQFPIYLHFAGEKRRHVDHYSRVQRTLLTYENKWDLLREPTSKLRDGEAWLR